LADLDRSIQLNPKLAWAFYCRGMVWYTKGDQNRSVTEFTRAIELDPRMAIAYLDRGLVRLGLGHEAEARKDFAEALRLDPKLKTELERSTQPNGARRRKPGF